MSTDHSFNRPTPAPALEGPAGELRVHLANPEALHGVLSVLHTRRVGVGHLRFDGNLLRIGVHQPGPHLVPQVARRVDVVNVELVRSAGPLLE